MNDIQVSSPVGTPMVLGDAMKNEVYVKEFVNHIVFDGLSKKKAFLETFNLSEQDWNDSLGVKAYRWVKTEQVQNWLEKANKSLEVDWLDKRVNALSELYALGATARHDRDKINAYDTFLKHLSKEEKNMINIMGDNKVNIIQVVQDKLEGLTCQTIKPDVIEADVE